MSKFQGLDKWLTRNLEYLQYKEPTPIQSKAITEILKGKDVVGIAKTGSGKTASFCLPILNTLAKDPFGIYCLILEPTRELAVQVIISHNTR
jgi:ATP-dependent RNA helicase DDX49/DBP8